MKLPAILQKRSVFKILLLYILCQKEIFTARIVHAEEAHTNCT